jgi:galactose-1-phosphate uridylyltransferase
MPDPLQVLADGTTKQVNPFTGSQVWTVPGRADRPLATPPAVVHPLGPEANRTTCAFCCERYAETTPEKSRSVWRRDGWERRSGLTLREVLGEVADFRRIANLHEIISVDYWEANHGYRLPGDARDRWRAYADAPGGREHLLTMIRRRLGARAEGLPEAALLEQAGDFFGSAHDVVIARRHFVDGATSDDQLASSGTLTPAEHREYCDLTVEATADLYATNPAIRYVTVFQNWLRPAGASFDHLHKQLVGIDEPGVSVTAAANAARRDPNAFNALALNTAIAEGLVIAENDHAVAFAGFGHRFPAVEVWSTARTCQPWEQSEVERHAVADLVHAVHAATGAGVPTNEEWHHLPDSEGVAMPWHVIVKWRLSTPAGFEGGTRIFLNTISPWGVRDRLVEGMRPLRDSRLLADGLRIGDECRVAPDGLRYLTCV